MQAKFEAGDDAEIAAAATHCPEEVGILVGVRGLHLARCGHDLDGHQVVHGEAPFAAQIAHASAQRQPGDAGVGHVAGRRDQAEKLRLTVDVGEPRTALDMGRHRLAVDPDRTHFAQVDDDPAIADSASADVVAATAHADQEPVRSGERRRRDHIGQTAGLGDQARSPVDEAVPDPARPVIGIVTGRDHAAAERGLEGRKDFVRDRCRGVLESSELDHDVFPMCLLSRAGRRGPASESATCCCFCWSSSSAMTIVRGGVATHARSFICFDRSTMEHQTEGGFDRGSMPWMCCRTFSVRFA